MMVGGKGCGCGSTSGWKKKCGCRGLGEWTRSEVAGRRVRLRVDVDDGVAVGVVVGREEE